MTEPTPREQAQAFTRWIKTETLIDFWDENNGEDELERQFEAAVAAERARWSAKARSMGSKASQLLTPKQMADAIAEAIESGSEP